MYMPLTTVQPLFKVLILFAMEQYAILVNECSVLNYPASIVGATGSSTDAIIINHIGLLTTE